MFFFFIFLSGVFSSNFGGVLKRLGPQLCTLGVLGLSCEALAAEKRPGLHTTAREPESQKSKIPREDPPREGRKKENCGGRRKNAKFWVPTLRGPTLRCPTHSPPTPTNTIWPNAVWPISVEKIGQMRSNQVGQMRSNEETKSGLARRSRPLWMASRWSYVLEERWPTHHTGCYRRWLTRARRCKETTHPELVGRHARARLVVLGVEEGGRFSTETQSFLSQLARAKARCENSILRKRVEQTWRLGWGSLLASTPAFWGLPSGRGADGDTPASHDVERDCGMR